MTYEEAVNDTLEMFQENNLDTSLLYLYYSDMDRQEKQKVEQNLHTIDQCSQGKTTFINCSFAIQGLRQSLTSSVSHLRTGALRLSENSHLINWLFKILEESASDCDSDVDDDKEDGDLDEDKAKDLADKYSSVLGMLDLLIKEGQHSMVDYNKFILMTEDTMLLAVACIASCPDVDKLLVLCANCIHTLLSQQPRNIPLFTAANGKECFATRFGGNSKIANDILQYVEGL
jgi:hypothetical protein